MLFRSVTAPSSRTTINTIVRAAVRTTARPYLERRGAARRIHAARSPAGAWTVTPRRKPTSRIRSGGSPAAGSSQPLSFHAVHRSLGDAAISPAYPIRQPRGHLDLSAGDRQLRDHPHGPLPARAGHLGPRRAHSEALSPTRRVATAAARPPSATVATALVLAARRPSASTPSNDATCASGCAACTLVANCRF